MQDMYDIRTVQDMYDIRTVQDMYDIRTVQANLHHDSRSYWPFTAVQAK